MCNKVDLRIQCDKCGYPYSEALYPDDDYDCEEGIEVLKSYIKHIESKHKYSTYLPVIYKNKSKIILNLKDPKVTQKHINNIRKAFKYFNEIILCVPEGNFKLYDISPARGDDRLYIHGIEKLEEGEE